MQSMLNKLASYDLEIVLILVWVEISTSFDFLVMHLDMYPKTVVFVMCPTKC